jgi:hypothetical protein
MAKQNSYLMRDDKVFKPFPLNLCRKLNNETENHDQNLYFVDKTLFIFSGTNKLLVSFKKEIHIVKNGLFIFLLLTNKFLNFQKS